MLDNLHAQLDFIVFFHGLALILLGVLCFVRAREGDRRNRMIRLIGAFGCMYGVSEWLDPAAMIAGDTPSFAVLRAATMICSFVLLAEAARRACRAFGAAVPGKWIHVPVLILIGAAGVAFGIASAEAVARYTLLFPASLGIALMIFLRRGSFARASRPLMPAIALGFAIYAVAAGLIVEAAPFWPARLLNQDVFARLTGVPIDLVRGVTAAALAVLIWAAWGRRLIETVDSPAYTRYLRRQLVVVLPTMTVILLVGSAVTNELGRHYRETVEVEADNHLELLVDRFNRDTAIADAMVKAVALAPSVAQLLTGADPARTAAARSTLDLQVNAVEAMRGMIVDSSGDVILSSGPMASDWLGMPNQNGAGWFKQAIEGRAGSQMSIDLVTAERSYLASYPVRIGGGSVVGVVVLQVSLEPLVRTLRRFDQSFFVVDGHGLIIITNRLGELGRPLWPGAEIASLQISDQLGAPKRPPPFAHEVHGGEWTEFEGRRGYALRRPIGGGEWSLVLAVRETNVFAGRPLGILISLLATILALFYIFSRDRNIHDRVQRLRRQQLQLQTEDLARKASTDPLTGLPNRLAFNERLQEELAQAQRSGRPFALVMCDIDHFKRINDRYGHPVGDRVLVKLSRMLAAGVRHSDLPARWGGEEFAILLPDTDAAAAATVADKLRLSLARTPFELVGSITVSCGVAQCLAEETAGSLLARADAALYRAKMSGRNRVELDVPTVETAALATE